MRIHGSWNSRLNRRSELPRGSATLQRISGLKPGLTNSGEDCDGAWTPDAPSKRSAPGPTKFGKKTAAPQTVTWSFGFRPSLKSLSANSKDELSVFHAAALSSLSAARHDLQHIIRQ